MKRRGRRAAKMVPKDMLKIPVDRFEVSFTFDPSLRLTDPQSLSRRWRIS